MIFYSWNGGCLEEKISLWEALQLSEERHRMIALTGGGGKTSTMFRLADELADRGKAVVVTTTTHIFRPPDREVVETGSAGEVERRLESLRRLKGDGSAFGYPGRDGGKGVVLVVGIPAENGKLKSMALKEAARLKDCADVVLIEADGAKCLPIKVPREGEPVIPSGTDVVIGCAGMDVLGGELEAVCFRTELAAALLGVKERPEGGFDHRMTAGDAAVILTSDRGTRKGVDGRDYRVLLNKADDEALTAKAVQVIKEISSLSPQICAVSCLLSGGV